MSAFITGSTGLCGSFILSHSSQYYDKVFSLSRSIPEHSSNAIVITDKQPFENWTNLIRETKIDGPEVFFSALGTTKASAGGVEQRHKIDYELNLELAKAAKEKGFKKYVLISSAGANSNSSFSYLKSKGQLEEAVINLGFDHTIILQPGLLIGEREKPKFLGEAWITKPFGWIRGSFISGFLGSPIAGEEVALAALKLSKKEGLGKVVRVSGNDVYKAAYE